MNISSLCCLVVVSGLAAETDPPSIYPTRPEFMTAVRGQSPSYDYAMDPFLANPGTLPPELNPDALPLPPNSVLASPAQRMSPAPLMPAAIDTISGFPYGYDEMPTYFPNWVSRHAIGYLPDETVSDGLGEMEIFEYDGEMRYIRPTSSGMVFTAAPQLGIRGWEGPDSRVGRSIDLPGNVYRLGVDLTASTRASDSLSLQFGFTPSINSDFGQNLSRDAYNWDGRGIALYRASPDLMLALGLLYWDRVHDQILPYAGFIYTPDPMWEFNIVFPNPRVSVLLSDSGIMKVWFYTRAEYRVEAYEIERDRLELVPTLAPIVEPASPPMKDKIELEDWRILMGVRTRNHRGVSTFVEAGWVFGRNVEFLHGTPGFDIASGFITRAGWQF